MSIFQRIRLAPANKLNPPAPVQTPDPETPIPATPEPEFVIHLVQKCAFCGEREATHPIKIGWFYIGRLSYVGLCDECQAVAKQNEMQHHMAQRKTALEHPAMPVRPRKRALTPMPVE